MRAVTWNMGCGSPRFTGRYRRQRDEAWRLLLSLEPDVVLLQEALLEVPAWVLAEGTYFPQSLAYAGQDAGSAVFVRAGRAATARPVVVPGSYLSVVDVAFDQGDIAMVSVHVDTTDQRKKLEALVDVLVPFASSLVVVGGDFNACRHWDAVRGSKTYGWLFERMAAEGFHDCHFGLHAREVQSFWGHQAKEAYQLDHFFVDRTSAARVRSCEVVTTEETRSMSDHSPVVIELGAT